MPFDTSTRLYSLLVERINVPIHNKKGLTQFVSNLLLLMAENGGFEPPQLLHPNGFRNHPLQPLE